MTKRFPVTLSLIGLALTSPGCQHAAKPYGLHDAPWSSETFEICNLGADGLRPVLFEPDIDEGTSLTINQAHTELIFVPKSTLEDGSIQSASLQEVVIDNGIVEDRSVTLREQYVGYLNSKDEWVDKTGRPVTKKKNFKRLKGSDNPPSISREITKHVTFSDTELRERDFALRESLRAVPNCTYHLDSGSRKAIEETTYYDYGLNNGYVCSNEKGYEPGTHYNFSKTESRYVVDRPDGGAFYLKMPDGEIKTYGSNFDFQKTGFSNSNGDPVCDWKTLRERLEAQ